MSTSYVVIVIQSANLFLGDAFLETGEKVRVEEENGIITTRLSPTTTYYSNNIQMTVDARDGEFVLK